MKKRENFRSDDFVILRTCDKCHNSCDENHVPFVRTVGDPRECEVWAAGRHATGRDKSHILSSIFWHVSCVNFIRHIIAFYSFLVYIGASSLYPFITMKGVSMQPMEVKIENGRVVISIDVNDPLTESKSGKSVLIASTNGIVKTKAEFKGEQVRVGLNVFIPVK